MDIRIGDLHPWELTTLSTVSSLKGVSTETSEDAEVQAKLVLEPVHSGGRVASEDLDEIITSEVLCRLLCIVKEGFHGVLDIVAGLGTGSGPVDARGSFCAVSAKEALLVEDCWANISVSRDRRTRGEGAPPQDAPGKTHRERCRLARGWCGQPTDQRDLHRCRFIQNTSQHPRFQRTAKARRLKTYTTIVRGAGMVDLRE